MRWAVSFVQAVLAVLVVTSAAYGAEPHLLSKAFWVDTSGAATFEDALKARFEPYQGAVTRGYTKSALWLRLKVPGNDDLDAYALVVRPAFLSRVALYDPLGVAPGELPRPVLSGRDESMAPGNHIGFDNGFVIPASAAPREVFLRITTTTSLTADVSLLSLAEAEHNSVIAGGVLAVYFALLLGFCLWGLVNFGIRRDVIYVVFAARMVFSMAHIFVFIGLLRYVFSDQLDAPLRDVIYNLTTVTIVIVVGYFDILVLRDFGASRRLSKLLQAVLCLPVICVGLVLLGYSQQALHANAVLVTIVMALVLLLAFSTRETAGSPYGRAAIFTVRGGYLLITLFVLVPALMYQSLIRANVPILNVLFLQAIISAVILSVVLSVRARQRDLLAQQALLQVRIKEHELKAESGRRIEKERFLSMLTHELRNPLALIRLVTSADSASGRAVAKAAAEMAQVIEKVEQSDRIDDHALQMEIVPVDIGACVSDIVGELSGDRIVRLSKHGHCICRGDETLVRGALRNLLENAIKYSPPASVIDVDIAAGAPGEGDRVQVEITNDVGDAGVPETG